MSAQNSSIEIIQAPQAIQKEISFKTEDDWTIYGTLTIPVNLRHEEKRPAALLLHGATHTQIVWAVYPGWVKVQESLVTLRIDWRGCGKSKRQIPFAAFSPAQRERVRLDVRAAIDFLAAQPEVNAMQIGVAAEGFSADPAIIEAAGDARVKAFVIISGRLSEQALALMTAYSDKSVLFIVSREDKPSLDSLLGAHRLMASSTSEIWVQDGLGVGLAMGSLWRNKYPNQPLEQAIDFRAGAWLVNALRRPEPIGEVMLQTQDGWILYAHLGLPDRTSTDQLVPGVILLPTALSDRMSYYNLERAFVKQGIAVLNLDWRGIGQSTNRGTLLDMSVETMSEALNDVLEGYKFLLSQPGIDRERIGILGTAFGAKLALSAAREIPQVKAIAMLTPVVKPHELAGDCEIAAAIKQPVLLVTGDAFGASSKAFVEFVARNGRNKILVYPGGMLGYSLFEVDVTLGSTLVQWFKERLNETKF
ncbi:MAG: dienelactone hydrolase family protein [Acidobacteriota bacterium]|nr:dienelactone hydrolase family protein [Blastocatellia bacterium]MDW8238285.1 dienelactone hydrolase family protein [Acidobacteriota bacterium]